MDSTAQLEGKSELCAQPLALSLLGRGNDVHNSLWPFQRCNRPASASKRQNCRIVGPVSEKRDLVNGTKFFSAVKDCKQKATLDSVLAISQDLRITSTHSKCLSLLVWLV